MKKYILPLVLFLFSCRLSEALPVPFFRNFTPSEYDAMSQNWALAQDCRGYIYVGNNNCLLRFNGKGWSRFRPFKDNENAIVRSLYYDGEQDRLYLGSFKEFGYAEYDRTGELHYTSLYEKSYVAASDNDEIWYITRIRNQIFFIYFSCYYVYNIDDGSITRQDAATTYFYQPDRYLYLSPFSGPARRYDGIGDSYETAELPPVPGTVLKIFSDSDGSRIVVTARDGLYRIEEGVARRLDNLEKNWDVANRAIQCKNGDIIVGFISSGIRSFDSKGNPLWHISSANGLIDNTILALLEDSTGNIWCALDKGIAVVFRNGDSYLSLEGYDPGKLTSSLLYDDRLYVGTNHGLNVFSLSSDDLTVGKATSILNNKQIWSLFETGGNVLVGENNSSYIYKDGELHQVSNAPGGIVPKRMKLRDGSEILVQGTFTHLYLYEESGDGLVFRNVVNGFLRPAKNLEIDFLGNIWIEHMYRNLYRIVLSDDGRQVESETEYELQGTRICKMGGRVLFHNSDGFLYYDEIADDFKPFDIINDAVGRYRDCRRVVDVGLDRYWLIRKNDALLIRFSNDMVSILDRVDCNDLNVNLTEQFESVISLPGNRYLFSVDDGYLVHTTSEAQRLDSSSICISGIHAYYGERQEIMELDHKELTLKNNSSLSLTFAVNGEKYCNPSVKCELVPFDYAPHTLGDNLSIRYQHLPRGSYSLQVWIDDGLEGSKALMTLPVTVKASPFASWYAIIAYIILAGLVGLGIMRYVIVLMRRQEQRLEEEKEKEIITIRNEQLEQSLLLKSKELATYSLIESRRNRVLEKMKEELGRLRFGKDKCLTKAQYDGLVSIIEDGETTQNDWEQFYNNFDLIHHAFFRTLSEKHPDLTSNDLRICAYLRLNMSTKELAEVMGISLKGAEAAKYRLRKKLGVDSSIPLNKYLSSIKR